MTSLARPHLVERAIAETGLDDFGADTWQEPLDRLVDSLESEARLSVLGREIAIAGGPPTGAQATELQQLDAEMTRIERVDVTLLMIALVTMATARYWTF